MDSSNGWERVKADIFWGEVADCDHIVQVYETDDLFIDALAGFAISGFHLEDCCIIIATETHLRMLEERLAAGGFDIAELIGQGKFITHIADDLLEKCTKEGNFDVTLFGSLAIEVMAAARKTKRVARLFGETSSLLFARGYEDVAFAMEHAANQFCKEEGICIFCAYSMEGFEAERRASFENIRAEHSKMISGSVKQVTDIYYQDIITS